MIYSPFRQRFRLFSSLPILSAVLWGASAFFATAADRVFYPSSTVFVRPGGTSATWSYGVFNTPITAQVATVSYYAGPSESLTLGNYQYSTNNGGSWTNHVVGTAGNPAETINALTTIWRFVDNQPSQTTTTDNIHIQFTQVGGGGALTTTSTFVSPDNAPTDYTTTSTSLFDDVLTGDAVATLTPVDTGDNLYGAWIIDSQSVSNLFTITYDNTVGNTATLKRGTGTIPAVGQTVTVTARYCDWAQLDASNQPIAGQGISKVLTFTVVSDSIFSLSGLTSEFSANTTTALSQNAPVVAALSNGNYAVVWRSLGQGNDISTNGGIYARIFNSTGVAQTGELLISPLDNLSQAAPAVAALSGGRFVVAYTEINTVNSVRYHMVASDGTSGSQQTAHASTTLSYTAPRIATLSDGNFAITWINPSNANDISARAFDGTTGAALAAEFTLNNTTTGAQSQPDIAALGSGNFVVVWRDPANSGDIFARRASSAGTVGSEFVVANGATIQNNPHVAGFANGTFVFTWSEANLEGDAAAENNIYFHRYDATGAAQGSVTRANASITGNQSTSAVTGFSDGSFLVAWASNVGDFDSTGVFGRRFDSSGTAIDAADLQLNQRGRYIQNAPAVSAGAAGAFGVAWVDNGQEGTSNFGVEARIFNPGVVAAAPTVTTSTTALLATATTVTITGTGFDTTPGNNTVAFNDGAVGTVTGASATQLTVTFSTKPVTAGSLTVVVTNGNGNSGSAVQVATVTPVVTSSTANIASNATTLTINGFGFSPTAGNNAVAFTPSGTTGTVTSATATSLTVTSLAGLALGNLSVVVSTNSVNSGSAVQVATVSPPPVAISSLTRVTGTPTNAASVSWTLTFASAVTGLTTSNLGLTGAAATGSTIGTPTTSNSGLTYSIPVTTGSTDGALTLQVVNATGLSTAISNTLPFNGDTITIDKTPPQVVSVTRLTPSTQTTNATSVTFRVTYSELVTLNAPAASRFEVVPVNGGTVVASVTGVTGTGATRDVTVTITGGAGEFRLRVRD